MATTEVPNYQGGDISFAPFLQGVTNVILANQQRAQQEEKAEQERADKLYDSVSSVAAKINPDGILPKDYEVVSQMYQSKIKNVMVDALLARQNGDMKTYSTKMAEANAGVGELNGYISKSKGWAKRLYDLSDHALKNSDSYETSTGEYINGLLNKGANELQQSDLDPQYFQRKIDTSKVSGEIGALFKGLRDAEEGKGTVTSRRLTGGGRAGTEYLEKISVASEVAVGGILRRAETDPAWRQYLTTRFPDAQNLEEAATLEVESRGNELVDMNRIAAYSDPTPRSSGGGTDAAITAADVTYGSPVVYGSQGERITSGKSVGLAIRNKPLDSVDGINLDTGAKEVAPAGDYSITALQSLPVLKRDITGPEGRIEKGNLATSDFAARNPSAVEYRDFVTLTQETKGGLTGKEVEVKRFAVPADRLPGDLAREKKVKEAIRVFEETPVNPDGYDPRGSSASAQNSVSLTDNRLPTGNVR